MAPILEVDYQTLRNMKIHGFSYTLRTDLTRYESSIEDTFGENDSFTRDGLFKPFDENAEFKPDGLFYKNGPLKPCK